MDNEQIREQAIIYFKECGIKKSALAEYLKLSPQYISDWLHKRADFDKLRLRKIEKFISNQWINQ